MSVPDSGQEPSGLTVLPPEEALRRARPVPSAADLEIDGLTESELQAFENALAER